MNTATFDTHPYIKQMQEAGLTEKQAEAIATTLVQMNTDLATKMDIASLSKDIELAKAQLTNRLYMALGGFAVFLLAYAELRLIG